MFTSLRCENFKCFRDTRTLELAPLTLLVGENNSGKSAVIQALHLPALTLQSEDPGVCLRLYHKDYDYGSFKDLVFQHDENKFVTLSYGKRAEIQVLSGKKTKSEIIEATLRFSFGYLPRRKEIYLSQFVIEDGEGPRLRIDQAKYSDSAKVVMRSYKKESEYLQRLFVRRGPFFHARYDPFTTFDKLKKRYGDKTANRLFREIWIDVQLIAEFRAGFHNMDLLGPLREAPRRTYLYSGEMPKRGGARGEVALQQYSTLLKQRREEYRKKIASIKSAFYQLGFLQKLDMRQIETRHFEFWTQHTESGLSANLADTGFGASQVLPVLISLFTSSDGSTLLYEQPEIHLHPAAQAELGSVFVKAHSRKKRIVVETHSEPLILRVQTEMARTKLSPKDVRIYYLQPDRPSHRVIHIPLSEKGEFLVRWPKGFFEENYRESEKLARARHGD